MRIDSPTNIRVTSDLSGSFSGSFSGDGSDIKRIDTANITLKNGVEDAETTFQEQVEDIAGNLIAQSDSDGIQATYDDSTGQFAISNTANKFTTILSPAGQAHLAETTADTFQILAGTDISIDADTENRQITINGTSEPNDGALNFTAGSGLTGDFSFTADQSANTNITLDVDSTVARTNIAESFSSHITASGNMRANAYHYDGQPSTRLQFASGTVRLIANTRNVIDAASTKVQINKDTENVDTEMYGQSKRLFLLDASANNIYLGNLTDANYDTSPPAIVSIVNSVADSKLSTNTNDAHELLLVNFGNGQGNGNRGGSIAFTGPSNNSMDGPTDASSVFYAHAAITGIQTASDRDQIGLSFITHDATGHTSDCIESARLTHNSNLHVAGDVIAFSSTVSDRRLKTNIRPLTGSLDTVLRLNGKTFDWTTENYPSFTGTTHFPSGSSIGLIAQEVQEIVPEAIKQYALPLRTGDENSEYLTVQYDQLVPLLIESIKELQTQINELQDRLGDS